MVGPTASGKSELAQRICEEQNGEVISADSMQIYRGLDIGTGKVLTHEMRVTHHGIDIVDPGVTYSAALFQNYARNCIEDIQTRGKTAVLCGGTGFYVRSVIDDYDFSEGEQDNNPVRAKYQAIAESKSNMEMWELLKANDEESASVIEPNDVKRVIRALELFERGESYAKNREELKNIPEKIPSVWLGLKVDRDILAKRISNRVDKMVEDGLVDEVKSLLDSGFREALCSPKAIGYREIIDYLDGNITLERAIENIKTNSRRYAKRQRTWFRAEKRINWIDADVPDFDSLTKESLSIINRYN
ncbi:MAG: tRNA (adenosine(37)-N6)-dimethylallyltransferase MiaA [Phoenicibacter congonensis]|uniref:tRNA dimethylallyltransferase n=1 Tax=Phoenicibacter congonensis TaxID=1944646 RepID=A0AA43RIV1_9ACTN|nr:tRNA (adenosine(37)-N6)-dimethylallyltransferase MiaA [Phoenicibacter congonensis]